MVPSGNSHRYGAINVGGPSGIHIETSEVDFATNGSSSLSPEFRSVSDTSSIVLQLVRRHSLAVALATGFVSTVAVVAPAVVIALLHLPWLLLIIPAIFAVGLFFVTLFLIVWTRKRTGNDWIDEDLEHRILRFAVVTGGRVSVLQTAEALKLRISQAEEALDLLARKGHASVDVNEESGSLTYIFPEFEGKPKHIDSKSR